MASNRGPFGLKIQNNSSTTHSTPQLYAVASGSYASNANYGSGAVSLSGSFDPYVIDASSSHIIRKETNKQTQFATKLTLFSAETPMNLPVPEGEVRIRTKRFDPISIYHSAPEGDNLNLSNPSTYFPLFDECQIDMETPVVFPASASGLGLLKARLLCSGDLALVNVNYSQTNDVNTNPILVSDIEALLGTGQGISVLEINGFYLNQ